MAAGAELFDGVRDTHRKACPDQNRKVQKVITDETDFVVLHAEFPFDLFIDAEFINGVLDAVFEVFVSQISQGEKVSIPGWLAVERTDRAARTGRNPQTGEAIQIPAGHSVKLTAGSKLKAAVTGK